MSKANPDELTAKAYELSKQAQKELEQYAPDKAVVIGLLSEAFLYMATAVVAISAELSKLKEDLK